MNQKLKTNLGDYPFIDFVDMNAYELNVIKLDDGKFNVVIDMIQIDIEKDEYPTQYGIGIRTSLFGDSLVELSKPVNEFINLGLFDHLTFIFESVCLDSSGDVVFEFNWNDYITENSELN